MFRRNFIPVWVGVLVLSGMFLAGQDSWPPPCIDPDGDGYGRPASSSCLYPELDCDNRNTDVFPDAPELCDGVDNQCPGEMGSGDVDEGCSFQGGLNRFRLSASAVEDGCYGGVFFSFVPQQMLFFDIPGIEDLPTVLPVQVPLPVPPVDLHLVWNPLDEQIELDPNYSPVTVGMDVGQLFPGFPCLLTAEGTLVLSPTSYNEVEAVLVFRHLDFVPNAPGNVCLLPDPRDPECIVSVTLQGWHREE